MTLRREKQDDPDVLMYCADTLKLNLLKGKPCKKCHDIAEQIEIDFLGIAVICKGCGNVKYFLPTVEA
ncbi:MAG: hypothetical protein NWE95_05160 [Candidatus Bathyarchaeota archaeon]|nr:hypothetical protein [Candidatus Bathyarchaeota archaeon]